MLAGRRFVVLLILAVAIPLAAQERGGQRAGAAPASPPMTMTVAGFPDGGQIPVKLSQEIGRASCRERVCQYV